MKTCIACGMPMERREDYPLGDERKDWCVHCAHPDGTMQTWEEKAQSLSAFIVSTQGLDPAAAREAAVSMMRRLPAWKERG